jgi:diguanylate cyclase (GGDEF)-like protein/PAS domain S-box-containing protein
MSATADAALDTSSTSGQALPSAAPDRAVEELSSLLSRLELPATDGSRAFDSSRLDAVENRLLQVKLGVATSLFAALRFRDRLTAAHSLRVGLICSAWSNLLGLDTDQRDSVEVAALLHDMGKVAVPDSLLYKPGRLTSQEAAMMEKYRRYGLDILAPSCSSPEILTTIALASVWFDGSNLEGGTRKDLPVAAKMLMIADAYDSMTTDQVYRRAMSTERAIHELHQYSGRQFDPELVEKFAQLHQYNFTQLQNQAARDWLKNLEGLEPNRWWRQNMVPLERGSGDSDPLFNEKLLDNMHDGVVFVDKESQILQWNRAAERLTGITRAGVMCHRFLPSLLTMHDEDGQPIADVKCPVQFSIRSGVQWLRRLSVRGRGGRLITVNAHAVPIQSADGSIHGAALLLHDVSPEVSLEVRCQNLLERATRDPLTQVANRSEFERLHGEFIKVHEERNLPCSLIVCDIDHFKKVNDTWGHPAGDEVLKSFAGILSNSCRHGDLVARIGGEEFVLLFADCNNQSAHRRAEEVCGAFANTPHGALGGQMCTASFGVTAMQPGDTPETMVRRADRALYQAKAKGRNCVVQLGCDTSDEAADASPSVAKSRSSWLLTQVLTTAVPLSVNVEKLRGFVADHHAEIAKIEGRTVQLRIGGSGVTPNRRLTDRPMWFLLEVTMDPESAESSGGDGGHRRTRIRVCMNPARTRDRRRKDVIARAQQIIISLRSYLMATVDSESVIAEAETSRKPWRFFPWFGRQTGANRGGSVSG